MTEVWAPSRAAATSMDVRVRKEELKKSSPRLRRVCPVYVMIEGDDNDGGHELTALPMSSHLRDANQISAAVLN